MTERDSSLTIRTSKIDIQVTRSCEGSSADCPIKQAQRFALEGNQTMARFDRFCRRQGMIPSLQDTQVVPGSQHFAVFICAQEDTTCGSLVIENKSLIEMASVLTLEGVTNG